MSDKKKLDENVEVVSNKKICGSVETSIICNSRCKICSSEHLKAIHNLRKAGNNFDDIVKIVHDKYGDEISSASLSRHFKNYQRQKNLISAQQIQGDLIEEATSQAAHTKQLVILIERAFKMIAGRLDAGTLVFDISDLEKLMKLRYQVMNGENTDENDILAIFQKASNKYGLDLQQGVLFNSSL